MLRTVIALLLLCIAPAASTAQPAPPKKADARKTVGVISAIGDKFALQKIGITVFGNELKVVSIDSWGIDDAVVSKVSALAGKQFNVKKINYPKGAFASYVPPGSLFPDPNPELREIFRKVTVTQKCDFYVVVTPAGSPYGNQAVTGLGMLEAGGALYPDNIYLHTLALIAMYDGQTFALVRRESAFFDKTMFSPITGPARKLDRSWWPASLEGVHSEKLKSATRDLIEQSLTTTIPELMGLRGAKRAKESESWSPFKP